MGSAQRHDDAVVAALADQASILAELDIAAAPQRISAQPGSTASARWSVDATLRVLVFDGRRVDAGVAVVVLGGPDWGRLQPGQRIRTTGKLKAAGAGRAEAGTLSATTAPVPVPSPAGTEWEQRLVPARLRGGFTAASSGLAGDARGLLPGMVTGDTSAVDPELAAAMKTVGMTHLTAVSGANCSLILGALLLAARSLRFPRPAAAAVALAGLGFFVVMVGPDASVLRAACMGAIGLVGLAAGRAGRGLSLLCVAATILLLTDPALATDFGFLLSVLATLGIVTAGRPIMEWLPAVVPRALAAGLAVPLSAQLYCGPVIVLLQPQFSSYALAANLTAAVLVPPVTLIGTAAVPLVPVLPTLAAVPVAAAGAFAAAVGAVARFFAGLPGASLPWPGGGLGAATMTLLSVISLAAVWLVTHPSAARRLVLVLHARTVRGVTRVLDANAGTPAGVVRGGQRARGLVDRARRGTLGVCNQTLRRYHQWLLPRPNEPGPRRRTPPPGAM
ncbi:MAG TPA: ComEC/Rec2 family competence protein [Arthrobacter sp.]|nr:ComEC/Rec2 family competence protein [Arthrobacter sp.]